MTATTIIRLSDTANEIERLIRANFPGPNNRELRSRIRQAAADGYVWGIAHSVALTASGEAGLREIAGAVEEHMRVATEDR
jgi:hypothetical protein